MENQQTQDLAGVMRRIAKLLAIAGDERADPAEAAAAAAMAEKVMRKYQLEHIDIVRAEFKQQANFETADAAVVMKKGKGHRPTKVPNWAQWLAVRCAKLHECEVQLAYNPDLGACVRFFGYKADVQVCGWLYDYLTTQVIRACRAYQKQAKDNGFSRGKDESESYRRGFVLRVNRAINAVIDAKEAEQQAASNSRDLVVVKAAALREHFGEFAYNESKQIDISRGAAFSQGAADGARVDINRRALGTNAGDSALLLGN